MQVASYFMVALVSFLVGAKYGKQEYEHARSLYKAAEIEMHLAKDRYEHKLQEAVDQALAKVV